VSIKKILFIAPRNPFSEGFSGDKIRASNIISYLNKKTKIEIICNDNKVEKTKSKNYIVFKKANLILKFVYIFIALIKLKPIQTGFFYSPEIKKFVELNHKNYDVIICHLIRSAQYIPRNFKGRKILEMTDTYSENYKQTIKAMSFFNPLIIVYSLEKILVKKYEKFCLNFFDKIILVSKKELLKSLNLKKNNKIVEVANGVEIHTQKFKFKKTNFKILFTGNIKYLPNKYACYSFARSILPKINRIYPEVEFHIVGEINFFDKFLLSLLKNTKVFGKIKNLTNTIKGSFCGLANLNISTGSQNKVLMYASFGLPSVSSKKVFLGLNNNNKKLNFLYYKNEKQLIDLIIKLKKEKKFSEKISKISRSYVRDFSWEKVLHKYNTYI